MGPKNFQGTRDILGFDMRLRQSVVDQVRSVFERFGFEPLETPIIETMSTLKGKYGEEGDLKLFRLFGRGTDQSLGGLRYDQTVPLARVMAQHWQEVVLPYRRYAIGPVMRDESTQKGRYRQFTQCDFDTVGSSSPLVDAEVLAMNFMVLTKVGFPVKSFQTQLNDRRLLNAFVAKLDLPSDQTFDVFRAWDKLDKVSREDVRNELFEKGFTGYQVQQFDSLTDLLQSVDGLNTFEAISKIENTLKSSEILAATRLMLNLLNIIDSMGVPTWAYKFNPLLARGLDYYTGPIFETTAGSYGSITGGGRFDNLIATLGGPDLPASGSSFGLDRLIDTMFEMNIAENNIANADIFAVIFDQNDKELIKATYALVTKLRLTGYKVEVYTGDQASLGKQLDIVRRKKVPLALILGSDELLSESVTIKKMLAEKGSQNQFTIPQKELEQFLKANGILLKTE